MGRVHDRDAGVAEVPRAADQPLDGVQIGGRCAEGGGDRVDRAASPAVQHQLGCQIHLFQAFARCSEAEGAGEVAGYRAAEGAVDAADPAAGFGDVAGVVHGLRRFGQRQQADAAVGDAGAAFGVAEDIRHFADVVGG